MVYEKIHKLVLEKIYLPLVNENNVSFESLFNVGDRIFVGSRYGQIDKPYRPFYSSVSGFVEDFQLAFSYQLRRYVMHLVIKNDYLYNRISTLEKVNDKSTKKAIMDAIIETGYDPSFHEKYHLNKIKTLVINNLCATTINDDLVKVIRIFKKIGNFTKIILQCSEEILPQIIRLCNDEINATSDNIALKDVIVEDYELIYPMFKVILQGFIENETKVSILGNGVNEAKNFLLPIGVMANKVIEFCGGYSHFRVNLVVNDWLKNQALLKDDFIIDKKVKKIYIFKYKNTHTTICNNCGKCLDICPFYLQPIAIVNAASNFKRLTKLSIDDCNLCGKCSLACPSNINLAGQIRDIKIKFKAKKMLDNLDFGEQ